MRPLALAVFLAALALCTATLSVMSPVRRRGGGTLATRLAKTRMNKSKRDLHSRQMTLFGEHHKMCYMERNRAYTTTTKHKKRVKKLEVLELELAAMGDDDDRRPTLSKSINCLKGTVRKYEAREEAFKSAAAEAADSAAKYAAGELSDREMRAVDASARRAVDVAQAEQRRRAEVDEEKDAEAAEAAAEAAMDYDLYLDDDEKAEVDAAAQVCVDYAQEREDKHWLSAERLKDLANTSKYEAQVAFKAARDFGAHYDGLDGDAAKADLLAAALADAEAGPIARGQAVQRFRAKERDRMQRFRSEEGDRAESRRGGGGYGAAGLQRLKDEAETAIEAAVEFLEQCDTVEGDAAKADLVTAAYDLDYDDDLAD